VLTHRPSRAGSRLERQGESLQLIVRSFAAVVMATLVGCATSPIPEGYTGPKVRIHDYGTMETSARGAFYFVAEYNGKSIDNGLLATRRFNQGRGMSLTPVPFSREVPAGPATLKLEARNAYGAPIQEIVMAAYLRSATSIIKVDLIPGVEYKVTGKLDESGDSVWLENMSTNERVGVPVGAK
jgi:hypothetical protein